MLNVDQVSQGGGQVQRMDCLCICDGWKCVIFVYSRLPIDRLCIDMKFVLLHEAKNEEGIRAFFTEVWELYVKVCH